MADKVVKKLAPLLPLAVEKNKKAPPLPAVLLVCLWALLTAGIFVGSSALAYALDQHESDLPSWMVPRDGSLTGAADAEASAIGYEEVWCTATQAGAAALALLLPVRRCRRSRRALAYVALAAAATGHLMFGRGIALFLSADPGCVFFWIGGAVGVFFLAAGDLTCFLALLLVPSEDRSYSVRELLGSAI